MLVMLQANSGSADERQTLGRKYCQQSVHACCVMASRDGDGWDAGQVGQGCKAYDCSQRSQVRDAALQGFRPGLHPDQVRHILAAAVQRTTGLQGSPVAAQGPRALAVLMLAWA